MASPVLPNPSNFLGVALVIKRSRDGPNFVFHYPPRVQLPHGHHHRQDEDETIENDDILLERLNQPINSLEDSVDLSSQADHPTNWDEHQFTDSGTQIVPWEHVAGFPTKDLASILTPGRSYHKRLFQLSLDPLYCVSFPIHVPENGTWKKTKKKKKDQSRKAKSSKTDDTTIGPTDIDPKQKNGEVLNESEASQAEPASEKEGDIDKDQGKDKDKDNSKEEDDDKRASMTMFNLVFILHPKKHEARELISNLYFNIIKKVNKAYRYSQQHSDFVWKESKQIIALKEKAREEKRRMSSLWTEILMSSSLAASVQDIYEAVSQNRIAALQLDTAAGTLTPSVQIPIPLYVVDLPQEGEEGQEGLWLTTANSIIGEDTFDDPGFLDRNFALLLMEDEKKIIAELQADPDPTTAAMVEFVRMSKPTQSFYQVSQASVLSLAQVRKYAQHFISWRRAIAIPPLHMRDVYILSPNCDTSRLPRASAEWQRAFPLAPPLTNFLADLSYAPRPYKHFCPGKPHRPAYLLMLAWLVRGGWVTQLCTFAYVVVWPEIMYEVDYEMEAEDLRRAEDPIHETRMASSSRESSQEKKAGVSKGGGLDEADEDEDDDKADARNKGKARSKHWTSVQEDDNRSPSPRRPPPKVSSSTSLTSSLKSAQAPDETSKVPSPQRQRHVPTINEQAAEQARLSRIAEKTQREAAEKAASHARRAPPQATARPSTNEAQHLAHMTPHVILDANKATGKESRYLSAIEKRLRERTGDGGKVATAWPRFWRYFNGHSALERVALQQDMKRKEAWGLLQGMSEYLLCVRHW